MQFISLTKSEQPFDWNGAGTLWGGQRLIVWVVRTSSNLMGAAHRSLPRGAIISSWRTTNHPHNYSGVPLVRASSQNRARPTVDPYHVQMKYTRGLRDFSHFERLKSCVRGPRSCSLLGGRVYYCVGGSPSSYRSLRHHQFSCDMHLYVKSDGR